MLRLGVGTGIASIVVATAMPTALCGYSLSSAWPPISRPKPTSNAAHEKRLSEKEILRCLKRYIARQLNRLLLGPIAAPTAVSNTACVSNTA